MPKKNKAQFRIMLQVTLLDEDGQIIAGDAAIGKFKPYNDTGEDPIAYCKQFACTAFEYAVDTIMDQESGDLDLERI
jgi:hypothetical protein